MGAYTGCAVMGGKVRCWGNNMSGELGDGTREKRAGLVDVGGVAGATQVSVAESSMNGHACARLADGTVSCWGAGGRGQLGGPAGPAAAPVPGLKRARRVLAGHEYTCALLEGGTVSCWGRNDKGQLGDGTTTDRARPEPVAGVRGAVDLGLASHQACAVLGDGTLRCWGAADRWQPALGKPTARATRVDGITGVAAIEGGYSGWLLVGKDGTVGELYLQDTAPKPRPIPGLGDVAAVSTSGYHHCALRRDGTMRVWGNNGVGQMGDRERGTGGDQTVPSPVRW
jgi:alpha-tubulin suppressor-like RCC1 family protein